MPHCRPIPAVRMFLDLFAGSSAPVHNAARQLLLACMEPVDVLTGSALDVSDDVTYAALCRLCASGLVGACCAAPPCSAYSRARLAKSGPPPVRTPSFPLGLADLSPRQQRELNMSSLLHQRTRNLLSLVATRGGIIFLENPSTSLLWLDPQVMAWVRAFAPFGASVASCAHGLDHKKSWLFWSNRPSVAALASVCPHLPGYHCPQLRRRTADGGFLTRTTACYPPSLASSIASLCVPFVSIEDRGYTLATWVDLLPARLPWPAYPFPVEDGAGTGSTACHTRPQTDDYFKALRHAWSARLARTGLVPKIVTALSSGSKSAPLSEVELAPFFLDLREFLQVRQDDTWAALMSIDEGQPFRLSLWHTLSLIFKDADADLFAHLHAGVPLGFSAPIPPCPLLQASHAPPHAETELRHCESAWKSALDNAEIVDELLQRAGWIMEVTGGDDELKRRYAHTAVGKLGLVLAEGRPPRLVVDSSISGVTDATHLPNRSANPTLLDIRRCLPLSDARERLVALVLDVSKAHRRLKILPADQGLLCFRHRGRLYQCKTLNFGARASGFYWARVAGLLVRLVHRFWWVSHSALIYVDDLISILEKSSAPLLAALLVVLLQILNVPMSWHKAKLSASVIWIGWQLDFRTFTVRLEPAKLQRLLELLRQCYRCTKLSATTLEKLTGKLLWLSNLFRAFRPSLAPLYQDQYCPPLVHVALSVQAWERLQSVLSNDLRVIGPSGLASAPLGSRLFRVAQTAVLTKEELPQFPPSARRLWVQISDLTHPDRVVSDASRAVMDMWLQICRSGTDFKSLLLSPHFECEAFADACADSSSAGLGGFVRLPGGQTLFFQVTFSQAELHSLFPWFPPDHSPQHYIAAWELLAQCALLHLLACLLPQGHPPLHVTFRCDNSATDAASWKGLSLATGMCSLLRSFFLLQERQYTSVHIDHVPGFKNDLADGLSRGYDAQLLGFSESARCQIPWSALPSSFSCHTYPLELDLSAWLASA